MTGDVYFNYGSRIESKRLAEAIAMPYGVGPICGFGSADINGNYLKVYPWAVGDENGAGSDNFTDPARFLIRDLIRSHHIPRSEDADISAYRITFGCIAKDGILFRSGESAIDNIPIEGTKGIHNQVLLFAEHKYVTEPVQNLVSFRAFWNESNFDFFDLYKKSLDVYYPSNNSVSRASINDNSDPALKESMSYDYLINKVEAAVPTYQSNQKVMVLIGVYGEGINNKLDGGQLEKFAIVPYNGRFPAPISYNWAIHSYFKEVMNRMETFLAYDRVNDAVNPDTGEPITFNTLIDYLEWIIDQKTKNLQKQIETMSLPIGSIILYDGEEIPPGWEEYSRSAGRIVIGYTAGGINLNTTEDGSENILSNLGDTYDPPRAEDRYQINIKGVSLPKHVHGIGTKAGRQDNAKDVFSQCICNYVDRDTSIDGNYRDFGYNPVSNVKKGALISGINTTNINDPNSESKNDTLTLSKLLPAITLRYIKKTASSVNVNK